MQSCDQSCLTSHAECSTEGPKLLTSVVPLYTLSLLRQLPKAKSSQPFITAHHCSPWLSGWHNCISILNFNVHILILRFDLLCAFHSRISETPLHLTQEFISPHYLIVHTEARLCRSKEHL